MASCSASGLEKVFGPRLGSYFGRFRCRLGLGRARQWVALDHVTKKRLETEHIV